MQRERGGLPTKTAPTRYTVTPTCPSAKANSSQRAAHRPSRPDGPACPATISVRRMIGRSSGSRAATKPWLASPLALASPAPESQQFQRCPAPASSVEGTWPVASRRRCTHLVGSMNSTRVSLTDVVAMIAGRSAPSGTFSYGV